MEIVLHIGYPKTGSTAIQSHIFTNRQWFLLRGVYVPATGMASGTGHAALLGVGDSPIARGEDADGFSGVTALAELADELRVAQSQGFQRAVLSWEGFAIASSDAIVQISQALTEHEVSLLVYVREQSALYQSSVLQAIKEIRFYAGVSVVGQSSVASMCPESNDFHATVLRWSDAFGGDLRPRVRVYARDNLVNGDVVEDFLHVLDLAPDEHFALQDSQVNSSLDAFSASYLESVRQLGVRYPQQILLSRALTSVIQHLGGGSGHFLSPADREAIRQHYHASNLRLLNEFRPENIQSEGELFSPASSTEDEGGSPVASAQGMRTLHHYLSNPPLELWQGGIVVSHELGKLLRSPSPGWRAPELDGVWTLGRESTIAFRIPKIDSQDGAKRLHITIAGDYYGSNTTTKVRVGEAEQELSLVNTTLTVEIDERVMQEGVNIHLSHSDPEVPPDHQGDPASEGLAFKVRYLSYDFEWDEASQTAVDSV